MNLIKTQIKQKELSIMQDKKLLLHDYIKYRLFLNKTRKLLATPVGLVGAFALGFAVTFISTSKNPAIRKISIHKPISNTYFLLNLLRLIF